MLRPQTLELQNNPLALSSLLEKRPPWPYIQLGPTTIWVIEEYLNPSGSVKDRLAFWAVKDAIGMLPYTGGIMSIVDASHGTYIRSLALFGKAFGFSVRIEAWEPVNNKAVVDAQMLGAHIYMRKSREDAITCARQYIHCEGPWMYYGYYVGQYEELKIPHHFHAYDPIAEAIQDSTVPFDYIVTPVGTGALLRAIKNSPALIGNACHVADISQINIEQKFPPINWRSQLSTQEQQIERRYLKLLGGPIGNISCEVLDTAIGLAYSGKFKNILAILTD